MLNPQAVTKSSYASYASVPFEFSPTLGLLYNGCFILIVIKLHQALCKFTM
jgi:hypothetical protein